MVAPLTEQEIENRKMLESAAGEWPAKLANVDTAADIASILQMVTGSKSRLLFKLLRIIEDTCEQRDRDGDHYNASLEPTQIPEDIDIKEKLDALFDRSLISFDRRDTVGRTCLFRIFKILIQRWEEDEKVDALMINLNLELSIRWSNARGARGHFRPDVVGSEVFRSGSPTIHSDSD